VITVQQNLYEVIGLPQHASPDLIKELCLHLAERYRPENNVGDFQAAHMFAQIEKAYETLLDPVKRAAYNNELNQAARAKERAFSALALEPIAPKHVYARRPAPETLPFRFASEERYIVEFTGSAGEYFRIWIVNLVLTVLTFGIYSAWAKVRKKRYFYAHTRIDRDCFEYRGSPVAILKGRVIAVAVAALFYAAAKFWFSLLWILLVAAVVIAPWLIVCSLAFNAYNTVYRNIRLHFRGTYLQCLRLIVGYGLLVLITFGMAYPHLKLRLVQFVVRNHSYGTTQFEVADIKAQFHNVYTTAFSLWLLFGIALVIGALIWKGPSSEPSLIAAAVAYVVNLVILAYLRARTANATWNNTRAGHVCFRCALRARDLIALYLTNIAALIVTLGLATPWAVVRTARYRAKKMALFVTFGLESFVGSASAQVSAAGDQVGEMFAIDVSL
jgi:uncharacterized membrane protein YjgN (DUF898 family)